MKLFGNLRERLDSVVDAGLPCLIFALIIQIVLLVVSIGIGVCVESFTDCR